jgi:hypothetical protein
MSAVFLTFRWDIPDVLYRIIKYKRNIVNHISINAFIKMYSYIKTGWRSPLLFHKHFGMEHLKFKYSYIVSFNDMFRF